MIPVHSRAVFILPSGAKKNGKIVSDYFAVLAIICSWFGYYFTLVWKIDTTSLACECSCILCPNFENFCPNNGQFFSVGDATASPASPCRTLMHETDEWCDETHSFLKHVDPLLLPNFQDIQRFHVWEIYFNQCFWVCSAQADLFNARCKFVGAFENRFSKSLLYFHKSWCYYYKCIIKEIVLGDRVQRQV